MVMAAMLVFYSLTALVLGLKHALRDVCSILAAVLLNGIVIVFSFIYLSESQGWRLTSALLFVQRNLTLELGIWQNIVLFTQAWSQFLHPVLLVLSVSGAFALTLRRDRLTAIMLGWLVASSIASVVAAPEGYPLLLGQARTHIYRALFLTPFPIAGAAGIMLLVSGLNSRLTSMGKSRDARVVIGIVIGVLLLAILNGALRAVSPLLTDPHNFPNP